MMKVNNPHDKLFKETFGDIAVTKDFVGQYLPKEFLEIIDVSSLVALKETFIQEDLRDSQSDLLFRVALGDKTAYLYFLFEHKSYQAKDIALQLLGYMRQIWDRELQKEKAKELSIIIPLLIYHGEREWESPKTIGDWIAGYKKFTVDILKYVPDFEYVFYDLSPHGREEVKGSWKLQAYLRLMKHIFNEDWEQIIEVIVTIDSLLEKGNRTYFDTVILYLLHARKNVPVEEISNRLTIEGGKRLMTTAEQLRQEGKIENARETARKLLHMNMDKEQIAHITELSIEEIEGIAGNRH